jgi:hypothetical protein
MTLNSELSFLSVTNLHKLSVKKAGFPVENTGENGKNTTTNPLKMKPRLLYLQTQLVPRSKHF